MKSFTTLAALYTSLTNDAATTNGTLGNQFLNDGHRLVISKVPRVREIERNLSTAASTQFTALPYDYEQLIAVKVTISSVVHVPIEITSRDEWNRLNRISSTSDVPNFYFIDGGTKKIGFYPTPANTTANAIQVTYKRRIKDLSIVDYTTGGILTATNGSAAIVGTGTTWTAAMAGRYLRITDSDAANKGDGEWYEIASASSTAITLVQPYNGTSIATGNAAYTIGQMTLLPEDYQTLPVWYAVGEYWDLNKDTEQATKYQTKFNNSLKQMIEDYGNKVNNMVVDEGIPHKIINSNLVVRL
jgi:hypothetical protein